jgi:CopA family copper-resistance protein
LRRLKMYFAVSAVVAVVLFSTTAIHAELVEYDLTIAEEVVNITGTEVLGMTLNGSIPGPVLRFSEGDRARIRVRNDMDVETSIHWHGVLVPPGMDGVPYISFPPIAPGATFTYEFPLRQSGTYWYHSHTSLQEQRGVYGAIVIEPSRERHRADRDYVVVLSDWTDENPYRVLHTLKRGSEWYAIERGSGQSILGAARLGMLGDYFSRELQRMPPMDISDVAYDRFLANGRPDETLPAEPGDTVRLRIIDGSATTYFHLEFAGGPMTIIGADGLPVKPVEQERFLISVAETYDVLVQVPEDGAYELRATAHDASAFASVWIGGGPRRHAPPVPKPNLYHSMGSPSLARVFAVTPSGAMGMSDRKVESGAFDRPGMVGMSSMNTDSKDMGAMDMSSVEEKPTDMGQMETSMGKGMEMKETRQDVSPAFSAVQTAGSGRTQGRNFRFLGTDISSSPALAVDGMDPSRPWPPYDELRATKPTSFPGGRQMREIRLTLDGDMERYVWFLNKKVLSESDSILVREGEAVRFIMINRTMMHHPMHLHGHFFRVVNRHGDYSPLKHTVNVAPMSTTVIEFDAQEKGDWFFHCHLLYHMKSGMARVVHYEDYQPSPEVVGVRNRLYSENWYFQAKADVLSNMTEGFATLADTRNILAAQWEAGWNNVEKTEWEGVLSYGRYFNRFLTLFAGVDAMGVDGETEETRGIGGFDYLLPLNVEWRFWVDTEGGARLTLEKGLEMTPRLMLLGEVEYDTHEEWEGMVTLSCVVTRNLSLVGSWHSEFSWGGGVNLRF